MVEGARSGSVLERGKGRLRGCSKHLFTSVILQLITPPYRVKKRPLEKRLPISQGFCVVWLLARTRARLPGGLRDWLCLVGLLVCMSSKTCIGRYRRSLLGSPGNELKWGHTTVYPIRLPELFSLSMLCRLLLKRYHTGISFRALW